MKRGLSVLAGVLLSCSVWAADGYRPLGWDALVPPGATFKPPVPNHSDPFGAVQSTNIELVKELDGQKVKLPGFVVPLEGDYRTLTSFLLVPYFGACIHVPPPPPNQIVHVNYPKGAPINDLWDAVWVSGTLRASPSQNEMAVVGYALEGVNIEPYRESDEIEFEDPWQ